MEAKKSDQENEKIEFLISLYKILEQIFGSAHKIFTQVYEFIQDINLLKETVIFSESSLQIIRQKDLAIKNQNIQKVLQEIQENLQHIPNKQILVTQILALQREIIEKYEASFGQQFQNVVNIKASISQNYLDHRIHDCALTFQMLYCFLGYFEYFKIFYLEMKSLILKQEWLQLQPTIMLIENMKVGFLPFFRADKNFQDLNIDEYRMDGKSRLIGFFLSDKEPIFTPLTPEKIQNLDLEKYFAEAFRDEKVMEVMEVMAKLDGQPEKNDTKEMIDVQQNPLDCAKLTKDHLNEILTQFFIQFRRTIYIGGLQKHTDSYGMTTYHQCIFIDEFSDYSSIDRKQKAKWCQTLLHEFAHYKQFVYKGDQDYLIRTPETYKEAGNYMEEEALSFYNGQKDEDEESKEYLSLLEPKKWVEKRNQVIKPFNDQIKDDHSENNNDRESKKKMSKNNKQNNRVNTIHVPRYSYN